MKAREVSGLASSIDVPVFVVVTVPSLDQRRMLSTRKLDPLRCSRSARFGRVDGRTIVFASTIVETVFAASNLIDELRQQYILAIEAAHAREWRRLNVRVRRPSAIVKARSGYFAG